MWPQAWEERAGAVFWEAMSHENGQTTPDLHMDSLWVGQMQSQMSCRVELDVCCVLVKLDLLHTCTATVLGVHALVLSAGGCRRGLCEKRPGAAPLLDRDSSSQLQNGPTTGHS